MIIFHPSAPTTKINVPNDLVGRISRDARRPAGRRHALIAKRYRYEKRTSPTDTSRAWRAHVEVGSSKLTSNVYFVHSGTDWVLIDTAWAGSHDSIIAAADSLYGSGTRPTAILITHMHPDHTGSVRELVKRWDVPVYAHPAEVPQAQQKPVEEHTNPLDRHVLSPLMKVLPPDVMPQPDLTDVVRPLEPINRVPGLSEWRCVPTPGHTPGHIALYRAADGVLLSGDAFVTIDVHALGGLGLVLGKRGRSRLGIGR